MFTETLPPAQHVAPKPHSALMAARKGKRRPLSTLAKERIHSGMKDILLRHTRGIYCNDGGLKHFSGALDSTLERYLSARYNRIRFNDEDGYEDRFDEVGEASNLQPAKRREICRDIDELLQSLRLDDNIHPDVDNAVCDEINRLNKQSMQRSKKIVAGIKRLLRDRGDPLLKDVKADSALAQAGAGAVKHRFSLVPFDKIHPSLNAPYLVKGIIPRPGLTVGWGPPKCGKSFVMFDMMMHVALGWDYRGHRVNGGPVVYCALEGTDGFKARVEAFRRKKLADVADAAPPFFLMATPLNLVVDCLAFVAEIRAQIAVNKPVAVVIDTLNRSLAGSENEDKDMAAYVRAADAIKSAFDCAVIVVHHCGHGGDRPRGHSSLIGAVDAQIAIKRDPDRNVVATLELSKDGPEGLEIVSRLEEVEVGIDSDGDPVTSLVVEPFDQYQTEAIVKGKPLSSDGKKFVQALDICTFDHGERIRPFGEDGPEVLAIDQEIVRREFYAANPGDNEDNTKRANAQRQAFGRGLKDAENKNRVCKREIDGTVWIWVPKNHATISDSLSKPKHRDSVTA